MGIEQYLIQLVCLGILIWFASKRAYDIGVREGAAHTVDKLHKMKIISYDDEGNIKPNPFFDA
tara:strand:- start:898 stop:1086 length:189 start_codon:yes stop_codon:yes gene_type:complete